MAEPQAKAPYEGLKWATLSDFTPGIISNSAMVQPTGTNNAPVPGKIPGQAVIAQGCIALPNGGLAPGPGLLTTQPNGQSLPILPVHTPVGTTNADITTGLFLSGPLYYYGSSTPYPLTQNDELIIGQMKLSGGSLTHWVDSYQIQASGAPTITNIWTDGASTQRLPFCTMTGAFTRVNQDPGLTGLPVWALAHWFTGGSASAPTPGTFRNLLFPDPTAGPGYGVYQLSTSAPTEILAHQNRVVSLRLTLLPYTSSNTDQGGNEQFVYTDPPNGVALITSPEVFVQEDPTGYGAWGSISASELFLVKNYGGGVVISGDLNSPTVTRLPGVTPTYGLMSRAASTPIGFVYASNNRGLWVWNGGNTSQKLSPQLEDNFFITTGVNALPPTLRGPRVDICRWGDWIIVSNDYLYDTNTGGWWRLNPGVTGQSKHQWYQVSSDGASLYAALAYPESNGIIEMYSHTTPSSQYFWKSYPIRIPAEAVNRNAIIREVVVRASGAGTVHVTLTGAGGTTNSGSPSNTVTFTSTSQPASLMQQVGANGGGPFVAQDITIEVTANATVSGNPAPIIYSIDIGYEESSALVSAP